MAYLGKTMAAQMPGRGLINPAFVIKIVPATDNMQQQPSNGRDNPNTDYMDNLKSGSTVKGKVDGKVIVGTVQRVIKNSLGDVTYVVVMDKKGKTHKIESTLVSRVRSTSLDDTRAEQLTSSPAFFTENKFHSFQSFINEQYLSTH